eukprot:GFYU01011914.1.p1 GENE.GFYU01011914.1~~GFYU01011914.1.p1  ORF type:complete len:410 (-),score=82.71 GFYU01011914.1:12-1241(-)
MTFTTATAALLATVLTASSSVLVTADTTLPAPVRGAAASNEGLPCDVYEAAGTPCVAAHSTVRALFASYDGPLYSVQRSSDGATKDITVLAAGGYADSSAQDQFCDGNDVTCTIQRIFDQSPRGNHLDTAPGGGAAPKPCIGVNASKHKLSVGGHVVYGAYFEPGMGYRRDETSGVATGDEPQSMYMVASGRHYNNMCCFDYGNAETNNMDTGAGSMEAIYFGSNQGWGHGAGNGPWVMADLEDGLWAGDEKVNPGNMPVDADFITAMAKGKPHGFALKVGDAQSGELSTMWEGGRPAGYDPMKKQGAIILGIGGDNSNWAEGTFYEGAMTSGYSTDAADAAVHANILAAGYHSDSVTDSGPPGADSNASEKENFESAFASIGPVTVTITNDTRNADWSTWSTWLSSWW